MFFFHNEDEINIVNHFNLWVKNLNTSKIYCSPLVWTRYFILDDEYSDEGKEKPSVDNPIFKAGKIGNIEIFCNIFAITDYIEY